MVYEAQACLIRVINVLGRWRCHRARGAEDGAQVARCKNGILGILREERVVYRIYMTIKHLVVSTNFYEKCSGSFISVMCVKKRIFCDVIW